MTDPTRRRLALLIDIDNGSPTVIDGCIAELDRYGRRDIRLAFGDYEHTNAAWHEACKRCAIELRHCPAHTKRTRSSFAELRREDSSTQPQLTRAKMLHRCRFRTRKLSHCREAFIVAPPPVRSPLDLAPARARPWASWLALSPVRSLRSS